MDWKQVIKRNREALLGIVAGLIVLAGGAAGEGTTSLPRRLRLAVLRILWPTESALRRLIVIVASKQTPNTQAAGRAPDKPIPDFSAFERRKAQPAFCLSDPRKRFAAPGRRIDPSLGIPRISVPGCMEPTQTKSTGGDGANAEAILRRIAALDSALKTLPRQARRLNRLMQRRAKAEPSSGRVGPIRPGHPPGFRKRPVEPVDDILRDCHFLARTSGFKPP